MSYRTESGQHGEQYLRGLLAPLEGKNAWSIAEKAGEKDPVALERFLNLTPWKADGLRDIVVQYVTEAFGDPGGVLIADPTGFAKKGRKVGRVQRQYSGTLGRTDNCQIGTFLAYADRCGNRVLVDRERYIPEKGWSDDPTRRKAAGMPGELTFQTRPQQVQAMIGRIREAGLLFAWFTADEEFGQNPGLHIYLEEGEHRACDGGAPEHCPHQREGRATVISDLPKRRANWPARARAAAGCWRPGGSPGWPGRQRGRGWRR